MKKRKKNIIDRDELDFENEPISSNLADVTTVNSADSKLPAVAQLNTSEINKAAYNWVCEKYLTNDFIIIILLILIIIIKNIK